MNEHILKNHGPLCSAYKSRDNGDFRSEGDFPAFMHTINIGLDNLENPSYGGWGGRYILIRDNTYLDPVPEEGYKYPERWYAGISWGMNAIHHREEATPKQREAYWKPIWRWSEAFQNDFAARADWCVKTYEEANHAPLVVLNHAAELKGTAGKTVNLSAFATDPDGNSLTCRWWYYREASQCDADVIIKDASKWNTSFIIPADAKKGDKIHIICEVKDSGSPALFRYRRIVVEVK